MNPIALACGLGAILLWSTNATVAKFALSELSVAQVQTFQFAGAAIAFLALRLLTRGDFRIWPSRDALLIGLVGLVGTMMFQYLAFSVGPITAVNLLAYAWPLLTAVAVIASGSSSAPRTLIVVSLLGFAGVALLISETGSTTTSSRSVAGYIFAILSAICMAAYSLGVARVSGPPSDVLLPASLIGLFVSAAWWLGTPGSDLQPQTVLSALYLGFGPMGLGYVLWSYAMQTGAVGPMSTLGYGTPVLSTLLLIASGEKMTVLAIVGGAVIVAACALSGTLREREA